MPEPRPVDTPEDLQSVAGDIASAENNGLGSSRFRNFVLGYLRFLLRMFFRRIEVAGLENIPSRGGGVMICWHPNGWVDGAIIATNFPHQLVAAGRHGILRIPVLGWMMRQCGVLSVYREQDTIVDLTDDERRARNRTSIDILARAVADGDFALIFPEGRSHDDPFPHALKTGAAHLYYRAVELSQSRSAPPHIIPVALHYNKKSVWGSQVLLTYHAPMALPNDLCQPSRSEQERMDQVRRLTEAMERQLRDVVLATESWAAHHQLQRARKLVRAERNARQGLRSEPPSISERVRHFSHAWRNFRLAREIVPAEFDRILTDLVAYDWNLKALRIEDHELDGAGWNLSTGKTILVVLEFLIVWLVLPFFLLIGLLVNLPAILLLQSLALSASARDKDEASIKLLVGSVVFPLTWLVAAILAAWGGNLIAAGYPRIHYSPFLTGVLAFGLSWFGGLLVLHFRQIASEVSRTLGVRFTLSRRRHAVRELLAQRASLYERFLALDGRLEEYRNKGSDPVPSKLDPAPGLQGVGKPRRDCE